MRRLDILRLHTIDRLQYFYVISYTVGGDTTRTTPLCTSSAIIVAHDLKSIFITNPSIRSSIEKRITFVSM